ncbi:N-acetylmuramoyl-L-alanine amidase YrvJ [Bacillus sp. JS]|nr:N-acetylmuramoyl-L-alanine amidase YrvJ [Bacillus sp. JS]
MHTFLIVFTLSINKSFYFYLKIRKDFTILNKNAFLMII